MHEGSGGSDGKNAKNNSISAPVPAHMTSETETLIAYLRARFLSNPATVAVLLVQVDHLLRINQRSGTAMGDAILREVARRLSTFAAEEFGHNCQIVRLDGPRFVLIPATNATLGALRAHKRSLHTLLAQPLVSDPGRQLVIRIVATEFASIEGTHGVEMNLRRAIERLSEPTSAQDGAQVTAAIANNEVTIRFQPQYGTRDGEPIGCEALLRWNHPQLGLLGAAPLVTAAHAAHLECALTHHAHGLALREVAAWPCTMKALRIALNITAADLGDPEFQRRFCDQLRQFSIDPRRITLELTEQEMLSDPASAEQLGTLRAMGCKIAIDDFGTGYSSLALLAALPIDYLKIDSGFTLLLDNSVRDRIIVRAIVDMAHALGLSVIAEGVENKAQLDQLALLGVEAWQGFLNSGPVASAQLCALLTD